MKDDGELLSMFWSCIEERNQLFIFLIHFGSFFPSHISFIKHALLSNKAYSFQILGQFYLIPIALDELEK